MSPVKRLSIGAAVGILLGFLLTSSFSVLAHPVAGGFMQALLPIGGLGLALIFIGLLAGSVVIPQMKFLQEWRLFFLGAAGGAVLWQIVIQLVFCLFPGVSCSGLPPWL